MLLNNSGSILETTLSSKVITLFLPSLEGGGAERVMLNLAIALSQEGQTVDLVLANATGPYLSQVPAALNLVDLKRNGTLASLPALVRYLRKTRPRAIISALDHANLVAIWAKYLALVPTKVVVTVHCNLSQLMTFSDETKGQLIPILMRLFFRFADNIVSVSEGVKQDLIKTLRLPETKITTIYNPVISQDMIERARETIAHSWLQDNQCPVIVGVGRLNEQKDFATLIYAFAELIKIRDARLMILGEGEQRQALETLIESLGLHERVELPGFINNPYAYLSRASLFVLSSKWEGLPTVLIEAMALGTPVLSTDCESGPREILHDGLLGELVPMSRPDLLASAMLTTLEAPKPVDKTAIAQLYSFHTAAYHYLQLVTA
jgi:glycosyltransferase involved in cell wall biosynthesis